MKQDFVELLWLWKYSGPPPDANHNLDLRMPYFILMDMHEAGLLYKYAVEQSKIWHEESGQAILEIGRHLGGATVLLAVATHNSDMKIVSVDIHDPFAQAQTYYNTPHHTTSRYVDDWLNDYEEKERIDIRVDNSWAMENLPLSMLFVDGDHSYEGIKKDFYHHWNYLHGRCLCHDYTDPTCEGVTKFIDEWVEEGYAEIIEQVGTMVALRKLKNVK